MVGLKYRLDRVMPFLYSTIECKKEGSIWGRRELLTALNCRLSERDKITEGQINKLLMAQRKYDVFRHARHPTGTRYIFISRKLRVIKGKTI